jgi:voltage-gated potassium channel
MTEPTTPRRIGARDWIMIALAIVSVLVLVMAEAFGFLLDGRPSWRLWLIVADVALCGVFFVEFLVLLVRSDDRLAFVKGRWYDLIGMIPITHPLLRGFRLLRIVRVFVVASRLKRGADLAFGDAIVERLAARYRDVLVEAVETRILLRSLDVVEPPLVRSRLPAKIADALDRRRGDLSTAVHSSLQKVPIVRQLLKLNLSQDLLRAVEDVVLETVVTAMRSDEINRIVQESFEQGFGELRRAVLEKEAAVAAPGAPSPAAVA